MVRILKIIIVCLCIIHGLSSDTNEHISEINSFYDAVSLYIQRSFGSLPRWLRYADSQSIDRYLKTRSGSYQHLSKYIPLLPYTNDTFSVSNDHIILNKYDIKTNFNQNEYFGNCLKHVEYAESEFNSLHYSQASSLALLILLNSGLNLDDGNYTNNNIQFSKNSQYLYNNITELVYTNDMDSLRCIECIRRSLMILIESEKECTYTDTSNYYSTALIKLYTTISKYQTELKVLRSNSNVVIPDVSSSPDSNPNVKADVSQIHSQHRQYPLLIRRAISTSPISLKQVQCGNAQECMRDVINSDNSKANRKSLLHERERMHLQLDALLTDIINNNITISLYALALDVSATAFYLAHQGLNDHLIQSKIATIHRTICPELNYMSPNIRPYPIYNIHNYRQMKRFPNSASDNNDSINSQIKPLHKVRVGFVSTFFIDHSIGRILIELIIMLNRLQNQPNSRYTKRLMHELQINLNIEVEFELELYVFLIDDSIEFNANNEVVYKREDIVTNALEELLGDRFVRIINEHNGYVGALETRNVLETYLLDIIVYPDVGMNIFTYYLSFARIAPIQVV